MESDDIFEFQEDYSQSSSFSDIKESEPYDVTIRAGNDHHFSAHRRILSAAIPYFRAMFASRMKESTESEITMEDVDPVVLKCMIDFAYTGCLKLSSDKVSCLLETSMYLQLDNVISACFNFLWNRIRPDNVLSFRACAELSNYMHMVRMADQYVRENFDDVCMLEEFLNTPFLRLKEIIKRDDLNATTEEVIFESVIRWVRAHLVERSHLLPKLLRHVRLPLLTLEYLETRASSEELIRASPVCKDILDNAKNCRLVKNAPCSFNVRERYCKEKHHLRCAKLVGYGMYSVCLLEEKNYVNYYDQVNKKWVDLFCRMQPSCPDYVACTEENIHIISVRLVLTLNLKTLKSTGVRTTSSCPDCAGIAVHSGSIYFFGGVRCSTRLVHHLDPHAGVPSEIGELMTHRTYPAAVSLSGSIYITGGHTGSSVHSSVETYNPTTGQRTEISPMRSRRWGHSCTVLGDRIYVCGGSISKGSVGNVNNYTNTAEVYDRVTDQWSFISEMNDVKRSVSLISHENQLYALEVDPLDDNSFAVERYDPKKNKWTQGKSLTFQEKCSTAVVVSTNSASSFML